MKRTPEFQAALEAYQQILPMVNAETVCPQHKAQLDRTFLGASWATIPKLVERIDACETCKAPPGTN